MFHQDRFDPGSVNGCIDPFHPLERAVMLYGTQKRDFSEGHVLIYFLVAHKSSRLMNLQEIWQKSEPMSR